MKHCGTQTIETPRLILRRFRPEDASAMYRNWTSDPEVTKYLMWPAHPAEEVTAMVLADWVKAYEQETCYQWAIVLREIHEPIGSIAVVRMDEKTSMAHIGYCIGRAWWHRGIMTEALSAVMDYLFDMVEAQRIEARHDPRNPHSGHVMLKCGMQYEGTLRMADWNNQGVCDAACYAMLKSERNRQG